MQGSLDDGLAPTSGTFLPTGSHTYVVSFSNCAVNWWGNETFELNGVASAAYNVAEWSNITAMVSADSVRGQEIGFHGLNDVTADGSAVWTRVGFEHANYDLHAGHRLTFGQQLDDQRGHIWRRFVL